MSLIKPSRRLFLGGAIALVAAPSLVRATSLMPLRGVKLAIEPMPLFRSGLYLLDRNKSPYPVDVLTWAEAFETQRPLRSTDTADARVSTVFLGIDTGLSMFLDLDDAYRPVLFETMVFGGGFDQHQERYCTYAEALAGHKRIEAMVIAANVAIKKAPAGSGGEGEI